MLDPEPIRWATYYHEEWLSECFAERVFWVSGRRSVMNTDALLHRAAHFSQPQQQAGVYEGRPHLSHLTGRSIRSHQLSLLLPHRAVLPLLPVAWLSAPRAVWWKPNQVEKEEPWRGNKALQGSTSPPAFRASGSTLVSHSWRQSTWERVLDETCKWVEQSLRALPNHHSHLVRFHNLCAALGKKKKIKDHGCQAYSGKTCVWGGTSTFCMHVWDMEGEQG